MRQRIRTVKPEAGTDEDLWDLGQETGLPVFQAYVMLWTCCDREGRFEWRPRPLKAACLPYWEGDFSRVLDALATRGLLVKYACQGKEYGVVRSFKRHQLINGKEPPSELPAPPDQSEHAAESQAIPDCSRVDDACLTRDEHVVDVSATRYSHSQPHSHSRSQPEGGAGGGEPPAEGDDEGRETVCPLNLAEKLPPGMLSELADGHRVPLAAIERALSEFVTFWTIGGGAGRRRRNWPRQFRMRCQELAKRGDLGAEAQASQPSTRRTQRRHASTDEEIEAYIASTHRESA